MEIPNVIEKEFLTENSEKIGWRGKGMKDNPIIIDDEKIPYNVIFKTDDLYIHLRSIDIGMIIFDKCQNIIIEDSIISLVKLKSCKNVIIKNNLIRVIKDYFGKDNIFEKNRIYSISNRRLFTIIFLITSLAAGLLAIFSYIMESYLLRDVMVILLISGVIILFVELIEKKVKDFFRRNSKITNLLDPLGKRKNLI